MAGKFALIIGNSRYEDSSLGRLSAPDLDVQGLEEVLKNPDVGRFDEVTTLLNEGCASVRRAVAHFYDQRQRDDLLLLYFSGHGVKDEQGHLYLALRDTESKLLAGTAIETAFIAGRMDRSFSKRQVLVLDCCHSGAFAHGAKAAQGVSVGTAEAFEGTGLGRVVLTATDSTQYAWEGDQIIGDAQNSLFTHFLIEGLKTGAADRDEDGDITVDELYDYVHEQVVNTTPRQTPNKWTYRQDGEIILAQNPFVKAAALPPEVQEAMGSKLLSLRLEAVRDLETLLRGHHAGRARAALAALKDLSLDDSRKVARAAEEALKTHDEEDRRRKVGPLLAAAPAGAEKQLGRAPGTQPVSRIDPTAEGVAEPVRIAESGQADIQSAAPAADNPPGPRPSDIFISYAHEDREKARALANVLTARGWKVWWDRKIAPGEAFDEVIERELGTCKCAIVLWSARSVHATWVRNEARRAARRKVLVPVLIDAVETPLEFENLQAADLTSWQTAAADHPEIEAVFDRIQALSPIPYERLARAAVEEARREFGAGRRRQALASLERFRPAHILVSRALTELQAEATRLEQQDAELGRRQAEAAQRQREEAERRQREEAAQREREIAAEMVRLEGLLAGADLDATEIALAVADKKYERPAAFGPLRDRLDRLREQARHEQLARRAVEYARHEYDDGRHQEAIESLEQFNPPHELVTRSLTDLRAEAARIERERAEAARREAEAARRQRELSAATAQVEDLLRRLELEAADIALSTAEKRLEDPAELRPLRERVDVLRGEAQRDQLARSAVADARREFAAGRRQAALAILDQFRPVHDLVSRARTELTSEAERIERARAEAARREAEAAIEQVKETPQTSLDADVNAVAEPHLATLTRFTPLRVLMVVAAVLALMVATWFAGVGRGRIPHGLRPSPQVQDQPIEKPTPETAPIARKPSVEPASVAKGTDSPTPETTPIEPVPVTPDPSPAITVIPNTSAVSAASNAASSTARLAELRTQAPRQWQAGQREQALNSVVQGLQIDRRDSVLKNIQGKLLRQAQEGAAQSRQEAIESDAREKAGTAFGRGVAKEREALGLRGKGRIDEAIRSFWIAADQFKAAAAESRRIEDNRAGPALVNQKPNEPPAVRPPTVPSPAETKPIAILTLAENVAAASQALRRYEMAYSTMRVDAVRDVYPKVPIDELEKDFAGASSCTVKVVIDGSFRFTDGPSFSGLASATGRMTKTIVKKSGAMPPDEREVTILLEKPGNVWIITRIR